MLFNNNYKVLNNLDLNNKIRIVITSAIACSVDQLNIGNKNVTLVYYTKKISYNDTLQLECTKGYQVANGLRDLRCNENEQFEGDPLQCDGDSSYFFV